MSSGSTRTSCGQVRMSVKPIRSSRAAVSSGDWKFHGPGQPSSAGSATASIAACTAATLPAPPHWATIRPPGRSAANRRSNSRSWSGIQWKVAVERIASTGSSSSSSSRSATNTSTPGPSRSRACSTIEGEPSTATTCAARQPLDQRGGDAPGAAAGVEHALVAVAARGGRAPRAPSPPAAPRRAGRRRRSSPAAARSSAQHQPLGLVRRLADQRGDLVLRLAPAARAHGRRRCPGRWCPAAPRRRARARTPRRRARASATSARCGRPARRPP